MSYKNYRDNLYPKATEPMQAFTQESWITHIEKLKKVVKDYRHNFESTHCRVHHCHKGPFICPICPLADALETLADDAIEWSIILQKVWKKEFKSKTKRNGAKFWSLVDYS